MDKKRCNFSFGTKEYHISEKFLEYHDTRWCKPEHRDQELYAMLALEGMQAGVSWNLVLNKEDNEPFILGSLINIPVYVHTIYTPTDDIFILYVYMIGSYSQNI